MRFDRVHIEALAHIVPKFLIKTSLIARKLAPTLDRLRIPHDAIESMTGVKTRGFWAEKVQPSDAATQVAEAALAKTSFSRDKIDMLISTSVSKDYLEPSVAALVHGNLTLSKRCLNFDVGNACLGFLSAMNLAASLIDAQKSSAILIVAGESSRSVSMATIKTLLSKNTSFKAFRDNVATLTLGSAAVAMLLVHESIATSPHKLIGNVAFSATKHARLCLGTPLGMITDAPTLLREGVTLAKQTWIKAQQTLQIDPKEIAGYALHQVGQANHDAILRALNLPAALAPKIFPKFRNCGAASAPLALSLQAESGFYHPNDQIMLMGIGSGLNTQMMKVQW